MAAFRFAKVRASVADAVFNGLLALITLPLFCFFALATLMGAFKPGGIHLAERQEEDYNQAMADLRYAERLRHRTEA